MIRKAIFNNFYSFYKDVEINFISRDKKDRYDYSVSSFGDPITKIAGFIGGNASGKTNALRFFGTVSHIVCRKDAEDSDSSGELSHHTFFDNDEPSRMMIEFETGLNVYVYSITLLKKKIASESLMIKKSIRSKKLVSVFVRNSHIEYNHKILNGIENINIPKIKDDISVISSLNSLQFELEIIKDVYSYFAKFNTNFTEKGTIYSTQHKSAIMTALVKDNKLKAAIEDIIRGFDIGMETINIQRFMKDDKKMLRFKGVHRVKKQLKELDFNYESRGTRELILTAALILNAVSRNSVLILDEIETGLHPEALIKLLTLFIDSNVNGKAQLIFSSHSLEFMRRFDMHQIFIVSKGNDCGSTVARLNSVTGIRTDDNFHAKYMSGAYGGFPHITA